MNSRERNILFQTCYAHFMAHFNMLVFPALVLPLATQFGMDMAQVVGMSFWMYLLFGISALLWGALADRLGVRPLLLVCCIIVLIAVTQREQQSKTMTVPLRSSSANQ